MIAPETPAAKLQAAAMPRAIEVGFPIVEINRLAEPERNSFKPIYQMHKWFARRASCVFRAILLGALKPAVQPDGTPTDLMAEFYKNHAEDPDTKGKVVLDPFMGGGTTVVEALRLGCKPIGIDLNPVAWFIVKTEIEPVEIEALHAAFERLAARPVAWNEGKPLRETLLDLYKTEAATGVEADVIYTFWVKHAICTDPTCKKEVPLFKDYVVAHKTVSVRYWRDLACPECGNAFDWETQVASLIAEKRLMVNAPRGGAGEGRPTAAWTYAPEPEKPARRRVHSPAELDCPCCAKRITLSVPWDQKKERKKVPLTVLLCPSCETVWQWRGPQPDGEVACPVCADRYNPNVGNVPAKGKFQCVCGNQDDILRSVRLLPKEKRLSVRPYAIQAYLPTEMEQTADGIEGDGAQASLFGAGAHRQEQLQLVKRQADPAPRSWAGVRQEVRRRARAELAAIEAGRYGGKPLAEPDVRLVCIGKCLELYSAHYDRVLDHEGKTLPLHRALQDISAIVDQLVTRDRPLPAELENIDSLSYVWLRCLMPRRSELSVDSLSKDLRALQVSIDDVKDAGLAIRGRNGQGSGRGRSYKVKQPAERLEQALANLERVAMRQVQANLFDTGGQPDGLIFADLWQALIALADAGESVLPLLEKFRAQWPEIAAGLRYCKLARNDWEPAILRVIGVMEGAPLLVQHGAA